MKVDGKSWNFDGIVLLPAASYSPSVPGLVKRAARASDVQVGCKHRAPNPAQLRTKRWTMKYRALPHE
jgi:hypothetical protein